MSAAGYESWFISARDPASPRALWIRHTTHRPRQGPESVALWCTLADRSTGQRPVVVKALVAEVPDGLVTGTLDVDGHPVSVSGWRGTVGHNWGSEHAHSWVWLHAAGFAAAPDCWLELVLARIRVGRALLPWTAMGALGLGGERIPLGGLGRRPRVDAQPGRLTACVPAPRARLELTVTAGDEDAVAVPYADPSGGSRAVRHAAMAAVELTLRRRDEHELTLSSSRGAYEYGTSKNLPGIVPQPLPAG